MMCSLLILREDGSLASMAIFITLRMGAAPGSGRNVKKTEEPAEDFASPLPNLYAVNFTSPDNGYIAGMDGIVLKTVDGGKIWKRLKTGTFYSLYKVAVAEETIWAIGESGLCFGIS